MTNAIGTGTRNLSFNVPVDERDLIARLAGPGGIGKFTREALALMVATKDAEAAAKLREIRRRYYGAGLLGLVLLVTGLQWLGADQDIRRPRNQIARVVRAARRVEA